MTNSRRIRTAADVAVGYAADARGNGVAYAAIGTGNSTNVVRLPFNAKPIAALAGLEYGYAAIVAVADHLKSRGFGRARIRLADTRVVADLAGSGTPPRALAMAYVTARCRLHGLGSFRLETAQAVEIRDLESRAVAEVSLHAAA